MLHAVLCLCRLQGTTAGEYKLSVANSHGDALKGSPFAISLQHGLISPTHSSLQLLPSTSIVAGSEIQLELNARDRWGNQVRPCSNPEFTAQPHMLRKQQLLCHLYQYHNACLYAVPHLCCRLIAHNACMMYNIYAVSLNGTQRTYCSCLWHHTSREQMYHAVSVHYALCATLMV